MSARAPTMACAIPAWQAADCLPSCLTALRTAGFDLGASVLVDDGSTDATASIAEQEGLRVIRRGISEGASAARNLAAAEVEAELICFVDADVAVHPETAERILARFEADPEMDALFGSYDEAPSDPGLVSRYRNLLHHYVHQNGETEAGTFWTGFGIVRRAAFQQTGGFDPSTENVEDVDFGMRLRQTGGRIVLDPGLLCTHLKRWTLSNMLRVDLFGRAVPWSRLILFRHSFHSDLNLSGHHRLNVALVALLGLTLAASVLGGVGWWVSAGVLAAFTLLNLRFFRFLVRVDGLSLAAAAIPLHAAHYFCAGLGFALVWVTEYVPARVRRMTQSQRPG